MVVKLFIEDICVADNKRKITVNCVMPLWKVCSENNNIQLIKKNIIDMLCSSCIIITFTMLKQSNVKFILIKN